MVELKFHCAMPMFVARQWIRHRMSSVNEYSGRYSLIPQLFYMPEPEQLQAQSQSNRQGRGGEALTALHPQATERWRELREQSARTYEWLVGEDVARELARIGDDGLREAVAHAASISLAEAPPQVKKRRS